MPRETITKGDKPPYRSGLEGDPHSELNDTGNLVDSGNLPEIEAILHVNGRSKIGMVEYVEHLGTELSGYLFAKSKLFIDCEIRAK